jgi:hypothetical protein
LLTVTLSPCTGWWLVGSVTVTVATVVETPSAKIDVGDSVTPTIAGVCVSVAEAGATADVLSVAVTVTDPVTLELRIVAVYVPSPLSATAPTGLGENVTVSPDTPPSYQIGHGRRRRRRRYAISDDRRGIQLHRHGGPGTSSLRCADRQPPVQRHRSHQQRSHHQVPGENAAESNGCGLPSCPMSPRSHSWPPRPVQNCRAD